MKTLQQTLEEKILVSEAKTVLKITETWLEELRDQVSEDDIAGVEMVMWFLKTKTNKSKAITGPEK